MSDDSTTGDDEGDQPDWSAIHRDLIRGRTSLAALCMAYEWVRPGTAAEWEPFPNWHEHPVVAFRLAADRVGCTLTEQADLAEKALAENAHHPWRIWEHFVFLVALELGPQAFAPS